MPNTFRGVGGAGAVETGISLLAEEDVSEEKTDDDDEDEEESSSWAWATGEAKLRRMVPPRRKVATRLRSIICYLSDVGWMVLVLWSMLFMFDVSCALRLLQASFKGDTLLVTPTTELELDVKEMTLDRTVYTSVACMHHFRIRLWEWKPSS